MDKSKHGIHFLKHAVNSAREAARAQSAHLQPLISHQRQSSETEKCVENVSAVSWPEMRGVVSSACSSHSQRPNRAGTCLQYRLFLHLGTAGSKPIMPRCLSNEVSSKWPKMTKPTMNSTRPEAFLACRSSRRRPLAALQATSLICLRQLHPERRILPKPLFSKTLVPEQHDEYI